MELLNKLNINIQFTKAISQNPPYAKFLKEFLSNKHKHGENVIVMIIEVCSIIIKNISKFEGSMDFVQFFAL